MPLVLGAEGVTELSSPKLGAWREGQMIFDLHPEIPLLKTMSPVWRIKANPQTNNNTISKPLGMWAQRKQGRVRSAGSLSLPRPLPT